jgi:small-conductance mechanosensitive channel
VLADVARWFIRLIVLVSAFDALGLPAVSQVLQQLLLWLPNLVVALVVLVLAGLVAKALAGLVRGATAEAGLGNPRLFETITRVAVWAFAIVVAVNQIGVATALVNTLFMATVGALALALGLAFGLGGRETAAQIVRGWYENSQRAAPKLAQAADAAQRRAGTGMS